MNIFFYIFSFICHYHYKHWRQQYGSSAFVFLPVECSDLLQHFVHSMSEQEPWLNLCLASILKGLNEIVMHSFLVLVCVNDFVATVLKFCPNSMSIIQVTALYIYNEPLKFTRLADIHRTFKLQLIPYNGYFLSLEIFAV